MCRRRAEIKRVEHVQFLGHAVAHLDQTLGLYIFTLQVHLYSPKKELQLVKGHENPCVSPFKKMVC